MARYGLILKLDEAIWLRIISKSSSTSQKAIKITNRGRNAFSFRGGPHPGLSDEKNSKDAGKDGDEDKNEDVVTEGDEDKSKDEGQEIENEDEKQNGTPDV